MLMGIQPPGQSSREGYTRRAPSRPDHGRLGARRHTRQACLTAACLARPRHAAPSLTCRATRTRTEQHHAEPNLQGRTASYRTKPCHACRSASCRTSPRNALPHPTCRTSPCHTDPSQAGPNRTGRTTIYRSLRRRTEPRITTPATPRRTTPSHPTPYLGPHRTCHTTASYAASRSDAWTIAVNSSNCEYRA